jgi:hypothetical protein
VDSFEVMSIKGIICTFCMTPGAISRYFTGLQGRDQELSWVGAGLLLRGGGDRDGVFSPGIDELEELVGGGGGETRGFFQYGLFGIRRSSLFFGSVQHCTVKLSMLHADPVSMTVLVGVLIYWGPLYFGLCVCHVLSARF